MGTTSIRDLRYAIRQFWAARLLTATAVLTLVLGIGGTTAIFTLIHAVMLRSLPVTDPARLCRIGDGDNCCVQGGRQDRWGMFSHPPVERLRAEAFAPRFMDGHARANRQKPGGIAQKDLILRVHLIPQLGKRRLAEIGTHRRHNGG